jgi:hypothetical protein
LPNLFLPLPLLSLAIALFVTVAINLAAIAIAFFVTTAIALGTLAVALFVAVAGDGPWFVCVFWCVERPQKIRKRAKPSMISRALRKPPLSKCVIFLAKGLP